MFWGKKQRTLDKEILQYNGATNESEESAATINVKIDSKEQLFSTYSYTGDNLNSEFCDHVYEKAKHRPITENLTIKIHTAEELSAEEVGSAIKNHYGAQYRVAKNEFNRLTAISLIMTLLGVVTLALFVLINHFWDNFYITTIVEIAAWVFIWEAVDNYFLQRPLTKAKCLLLQRIFTAEIQICQKVQIPQGEYLCKTQVQ